jgi:O-antigen/teichoic acid export membrane protein
MIAFNAIMQLGAFGGVLLFQTLYMILVARILGPEDFGRFSFAWGVIHIVLIGGNLGLGNTALRKISADREGSAEISQIYFWLRGILALILFLPVLMIAYFVPETPQTRGMLVVFGGGMLFHALSMAMNVVFQAHGKLYLGSINVFVVFGGHAIIGMLILSLGGHLIALSTAYLAASIIGFLLNLRVFNRTIHGFRIKRQEGWGEFVKQSIPVGLGSLFQSISGRIPIALLILLAGPLETGIFSAAGRIPMVLHNVPQALLAAVIPVMAAHQQKSILVQKLFNKTFLIMVGLALPLSIGFFIFARPLILLLYGGEYTASIVNLRILTWSILPMFVAIAFAHVVLSQDHLVKRVPWVTGVTLAVGIFANLILIPRLGDQGAAYSVLVTQVVAAIGYAFAAKGFLFKRLIEQ